MIKNPESEVNDMKYTSAEAAKLLRTLNEEHAALLSREEASKSFVAAISEDIESVRPDYNYDQTAELLRENERKVRIVKHAINVFNTTHEVPGFGMTIDEMLVYIPMLTARKQRLSNMANVLPKQRERSYGQSSIIEYRYANYPIEKAEADLTAVTDELSAAQIALDRVNSTEMMEIEL